MLARSGTSGLPRVLIADRSADNAAWLERVLADQAEVVRALDAQTTLSLLSGIRPHVLVIGSKLADMPGATLIKKFGATLVEHGAALIFLADRASAAPVPDEDALFYVISQDMSTDDVQAILGSAVVSGSPREYKPSPEEAARLRRMLEVPRLFAQQSDLKGATRVATRALLEFLAAERAECLFYDAGGGTLWSESQGDEKYQGGREMPARLGLAGFAARTGHAVCVDRASSDPRYRREVDDPTGHGDERLLAQPIADSDGQIHAVLVAVRPRGADPFSPEDRSMVAWLAHHLGPLTGQLALKLETETVLEEALEDEQRMFRPEAVAAYGAISRRGDVVRVSPAWVSYCYWLVVALVAAVIGFVVLGRVHEYSMGPAVVYHSGRTDVASPVVGTVLSIEVASGEEVDVGQVLARFHAADEAADLTRLDREWEGRVREYLANPADSELRGALGALRAQRERLLERLSVRAEHAGVVTDVRVSPGQQLVVGQTILSITRPESAFNLVALLPGGDRPLIRPGMPVRLELGGYRYAYQELEVESVASEVIGPGEAGRFLGSQLADSIPLAGPVVIVTARLSRPTFEADGQSYTYHHGMQGTAEVRVRSTSVLRALLPGTH